MICLYVVVARITYARLTGSEFAAFRVLEWLGRGGVKTLFIEPGSPWENGFMESFDAKQ